MTDPVVNTTGYAYDNGKPTNRPRLNLNVSFILDTVPGPYHQPEDMMQMIARHSYVDTVTLLEDTDQSPPTKQITITEDQIVIDRQALLDIVRTLDIGAKVTSLPAAMDILREPFFSDEIGSGKARKDFSMNKYK